MVCYNKIDAQRNMEYENFICGAYGIGKFG